MSLGAWEYAAWVNGKRSGRVWRQPNFCAGLIAFFLGRCYVWREMNVVFLRQTSLRRRVLAGMLALFLGFLFLRLDGAALDEAEEALRRGDYEDCIEHCRNFMGKRSRPNEDWFLLLLKAQMTLGKYADAWETLQKGLEATRGRSVRLYYAGRKAAQFQNKPEVATKFVEKIDELVGRWGGAVYGDPINLVALGKTALLLGQEPRWVLEFFFDPGRQADPPVREAILAAGDLALDKEDFAVAGASFQEGLNRFGEDPDFLFGLAVSLSNSEPEETAALLERALEANPRHVPSLLLLADHAVNAEEYRLAEETLDQVLEVNGDHPEAWAYRAVIAHLESDFEGEWEARQRGLKHWKTNPAVDHLIGKKLSQKYRFQEGADYQRAAMRLDPGWTKAQLQLAQDLLRLGQEEEGWQWAARSHEKDGYNQTAYNLLTLKTTLDKYAVLENDSFLVRMPADEAPIFGDEVLELLEEAKDALCDKYGVTLERQVILELFGHQKHFAVRTFGMPHNPGFLGVCFGNVITANSPSTQSGHPSNWRAVLWHEFCHVVTLTMTRNRMPRWLSEGISVYEEVQKDSSWGQSMTPAYRRRIMDGRLLPVSELSAAFIKAETGEDMQFAYYESSLAVRYLVETYGAKTLIGVLQDLGAGVSINEALAKNTVPIDQLDEQFAAYAKTLAAGLGEGLNWDVPEASLDGVPIETALSMSPDNYYLLLRRAKERIAEEQWEEALDPLRKILSRYPLQPGNNEAPRLLSQCYRELGAVENERRILRQIAETDHEAPDIYRRLVRMDTDAERWERVDENLMRLFAVNPFLPQLYRDWARCGEALGRDAQAIRAWEKLLRLEPPDLANVHYQAARLLHRNGKERARGHVLRALEEAPRFRDAYRLLRNIKGLEKTPSSPPPASKSE